MTAVLPDEVPGDPVPVDAAAQAKGETGAADEGNGYEGQVLHRGSPSSAGLRWSMPYARQGA
ncbi:hypothetical protein [Streptomyces canus]|uniref:hypothetical protein n=1 Tax=Streptomyces canus TaxID=58343 RepID=UPI0007485794|nr:hypothetical protein [Streptomyces canus]KUN14001.1 hypothetical protein AQI96_07465 [Streptomyces canus]